MEENRDKRVTFGVTAREKLELERYANEWRTTVGNLVYAAIRREFANFE